MTGTANGGRSAVTNLCGTTNYIWNTRNQLVGISGFDSLCAPLSASFKYDALGRRTEKTVNGRTINYIYDGLDIVQEIENGTVSANYIRTLNIDEPLARIKSDGTVRYYQQDALGSIIALTDENGVIRTQYTYDPFGNTSLIGEPSDNPFQYTGRENDGTGLYYYRARYYSPVLQRFISEDPIRFGGGLNFFAYVGNNPVNFVDPLGLSPIIDPNRPGEKIPRGLKDNARAIKELEKQLKNQERFLKGLKYLDKLLTKTVVSKLIGVPLLFGTLLHPDTLSDPVLGPDGKWYYPDGTPVKPSFKPCGNK